LLDQFSKQTKFLLDGQFQSVRFKLRKPKSLGNYYFRINRQYRAICKLDGATLYVYRIDDHQD